LKKVENFRLLKSGRQRTTFTMQSTTNSPQFTIKLHPKICKTPVKPHFHHAKKNISKIRAKASVE
jgi:hypothetical protein